ncbi:MAG: tetratricopeptide repeat protein [Tissierella sp.]|uniref:tetratricopeptide repeat protein n=1 Tax=Tissierella sp. TaxID=41274 RepID=UPI003F9DD16A
MNYIEKQLENRTEDISFIQIKEDSNLTNESISITEIPLPILTNSLIEEVKSKKGEEIGLKKIIDGIVYLLGVGDRDFPYIEEYKKIIKEIASNIEGEIFLRAINSFKEEDIENSLINSRALLNLNPENIKGLFQYGLVLETIGKDLLEKEEIESGEEVLKLSTLNFEKILDIDEEYALAYYKLGYHYKHFNQYVKADLIWEKFIKLSNDELLKKEVREELDTIKDEVNFETGLTYISYNDHSKALEALLKLLPAYKDSWNVNYLIGQSYKNLGEIDLAIEHFDKAIKNNSEETDLYNELGALYYNVGNIYKAIDVFSEGLKHSDLDYKLLFNRSLMYSSVGDYNKALADAQKAYELNQDENIMSQVKWLKERI